MQLSIAEILTEAGKKSKKADKIAYLREHNSQPLQVILRLTYDTDVEFLVPDTTPPYKKNEYTDAQGMLYKEARRLRIFVKGGGYDDLNQLKREQLFISLLEDVQNEDGELLCRMIAHKPTKGLTRKTVEEAFPDLFQARVVK